MVITISNTDDFIRALRENGDFQAAARRELLTQDLLELPREFRGFQERTDERLEEIGGEIKEARSDIDGLGEAFRQRCELSPVIVGTMRNGRQAAGQYTLPATWQGRWEWAGSRPG